MNATAAVQLRAFNAANDLLKRAVAAGDDLLATVAADGIDDARRAATEAGVADVDAAAFEQRLRDSTVDELRAELAAAEAWIARLQRKQARMRERAALWLPADERAASIAARQQAINERLAVALRIRAVLAGRGAA